MKFFFFKIIEEIGILNTQKKKTEWSFGDRGDFGRGQAQGEVFE